MSLKGVELTHYQIVAAVLQNAAAQCAICNITTKTPQLSLPLGYLSMAQVVGQVNACVTLPSMRVPAYTALRMDFVSAVDNVIDLQISRLAIHQSFRLALKKEERMRERISKIGGSKELILIGSPADEETCKEI